MGIWRVTVLLISLSYQGKAGVIRCYCNLEECVSNNSSCTGEGGGCFSNFLDSRDITQAEYGCLHLLKRERQKECGSLPRSPSWSSTSLLLCCTSDMCNQLLDPMSLLTHSIIGSLINATEGQNTLVGSSYGSGNYDHQTNEVWFKAATIAVPICGAMILFLLVALAFKILRADHLNVEKYCGKSKSNANYGDFPVISFKSSELNSEDLSKKMPLLYETRQVERPENFRTFTTARIHFGQNVNMLRENDNSGRAEKNLENAKINLEKPWFRRGDVATTSSSGAEEESNNNSSAKEKNNSCSTSDGRVNTDELYTLPVLSLNLDKPESLSSCNLYRNPKTYGQSTLSVNAQDKMYDKYLL